jgi:hypothetical protein
MHRIPTSFKGDRKATKGRDEENQSKNSNAGKNLQDK